ncbi:uncharacterized protein LOC128395130 isoform X2 [Panonychus citri]|nr:uncharacterized protein LOC128395130 isoform X2 [Panonychus citri]
MIDTAVRTIDGRIYIFKGENYFNWSSDLSKPLLPDRPLADWNNLITGIHASLTITDQSNRLFGNTFFFKENRWFQFSNQQFIRTNLTSYWIVDPIHAKYILPMYNESIFGFFSLISPRLVVRTIFEWYNFHSPFNPRSIPSGFLVSDYFTIDLLSVRAIVDFPDDRWLVFFDDETNGYFCILNFPGDLCNEMFIWNTDICPDLLNQFIEDSIFLLAIEKIPFGLDRFFLIISAILITVLIIQVILIIGLIAIIDDFLAIKNRVKIFRFLLDLQKQPNLPYISFGRYLLRTAEMTFSLNENEEREKQARSN